MVGFAVSLNPEPFSNDLAMLRLKSTSSTRLVDKEAISLLRVQQFVSFESDEIYTSILAYTPSVDDMFHSFIFFCETEQKDENYITELPVILD